MQEMGRALLVREGPTASPGPSLSAADGSNRIAAS
jgi:hypothetical protein